MNRQKTVNKVFNSTKIVLLIVFLYVVILLLGLIYLMKNKIFFPLYVSKEIDCEIIKNETVNN